MQFEVIKNNSRLIVTVHDGILVAAESPTHPCYRSMSIGQPWAEVRKLFEAEGFLIHHGN